MINLVIKDILLTKKVLPLVFVYGVFMIFLFDNGLESGKAAFTAVSVAVAYLLMAQSTAYDEVNKSEMMMLSIPVKRKDIVLAKYLSVLVFGLLGALSYKISAIILSLFPVEVHPAPINLESVVGLFVALAFLTSIYYPVYFRLGYLKTKYIYMLLFFAAFFLPIAIFKNLNNKDYPLLNTLIGFLHQLPDTIIIVLIVLAALLLLAFSMTLSIKFYNRREF